MNNCLHTESVYMVNNIIPNKTQVVWLSLCNPITAGDTAGVVGDNVDNAYVSVSHISQFHSVYE